MRPESNRSPLYRYAMNLLRYSPCDPMSQVRDCKHELASPGAARRQGPMRRTDSVRGVRAGDSAGQQGQAAWSEPDCG